MDKGVMDPPFYDGRGPYLRRCPSDRFDIRGTFRGLTLPHPSPAIGYTGVLPQSDGGYGMSNLAAAHIAMTQPYRSGTSHIADPYDYKAPKERGERLTRAQQLHEKRREMEAHRLRVRLARQEEGDPVLVYDEKRDLTTEYKVPLTLPRKVTKPSKVQIEKMPSSYIESLSDKKIFMKGYTGHIQGLHDDLAITYERAQIKAHYEQFVRNNRKECSADIFKYKTDDEIDEMKKRALNSLRMDTIAKREVRLCGSTREPQPDHMKRYGDQRTSEEKRKRLIEISRQCLGVVLGKGVGFLSGPIKCEDKGSKARKAKRVRPEERHVLLPSSEDILIKNIGGFNCVNDLRALKGLKPNQQRSPFEEVKGPPDFIPNFMLQVCIQHYLKAETKRMEARKNSEAKRRAANVKKIQEKKIRRRLRKYRETLLTDFKT